MLQPTTKNKFIVAFVCLGLTIVFGFIYYFRYFKFRECIDGVCSFEGAASGGAWSIPTIIFAMLAVDRMLKALRARKSDLEDLEDAA